jgi:type I restriction enzyme M protein
MVRIGWMNMVLHGIEDPQIHQRDSLARPKEGDPLHDLLESESADCVLANPPFTGSVDTADLDLSAFPKSGKSGKRVNQAITGKSELLFVWRMLNLLRVGGKCAVIVPEGVLFGNTEAHLRLRRELLTEHLVEAIISLPAGVFQPYTGVKTSILMFQKETSKEDRDKWKPIDLPRTQQVWFYEVSEEAFTLDPKRNERRGLNNDLWDIVEKFKTRNASADPLIYYQPDYHLERWRTVDKRTLEVFSDYPEVQRWKDQVAAVHELFSDLPADPEEAKSAIRSKTAAELEELVKDFLFDSVKIAADEIKTVKSDEEKREIVGNYLKKAAAPLRSLCNQQKFIFDQDDQEAWPLFQKTFLFTIDRVVEVLTKQVLTSGASLFTDKLVRDAPSVIKRIAREFAKLDGYDVMLRSIEITKQKTQLVEAKNWATPVRVFVRNDEWQSGDGNIKGSHSEKGEVHPEYIASINLYDVKGNLVEGLLAPECIEARGWNLSAGQYKPFTFTAVRSQKSVVEMIQELKVQEQKISERLDRLLRVVEVRE